MNELLDGVNWLAVIVGFMAAYLLGWLWYSPKLFGSKWAEAVGIDMSGETEMPAMAMFVQAVGTFLLSWLVGITAASNALLTIILIAVTLMTLMAAGSMYCKKPGSAIAIEMGYVFTMVVLMIICQGIF
ncbi:twitching motility protein PilT [Bermanella sp. 47_1433_sub80_T6]|nr:twitching motility protein PilT [Bermanella sp. 47_1433_sub80_T6]